MFQKPRSRSISGGEVLGWAGFRSRTFPAIGSIGLIYQLPYQADAELEFTSVTQIWLIVIICKGYRFYVLADVSCYAIRVECTVLKKGLYRKLMTSQMKSI